MKELEFPTYPPVAGPRLSWSAILAGAAVALAALASLNTLGAGAGAAPWSAIAAGVASYWAGGWIAARLSDSGRRADGVLYGIVAWAAITLATIYLPAFALRIIPPLGANGAVVFGTLACEAAAAALGGLAGARLYLPVPIAEYRARRASPPMEEITPLKR